MNFVIFDLETTGLSPKEEQIIEIAAKKIDINGEELGVFHKFVSLYKVDSISDFISNLTNITNEMLIEKGEDITFVIEQFNDFCKDSVLVAQNAKFDMSFLMTYHLEELNVSYSPLCIDTINLAKNLRPNMESYKLAKLVEYFNVNYDPNAHHRADYDVDITTEVLINQLKEFNFSGDINELLKISNFVNITDKQSNFLDSLMGKNNHYITSGHIFSKQTASFHIDHYLK